MATTGTRLGTKHNNGNNGDYTYEHYGYHDDLDGLLDIVFEIQ
jgi:hypothetical protein